MKLTKVMTLIIGVLFVMLPVLVEAKSINSYDYYDTSLIGYATKHSGGGSGTTENEKEEHVGDNICQEPNVINALRVVGYFIFIGKIIVPFIIIGYGIFDLSKAVTGGDSDKVAKGVKTIGIRVLIGILIFAVPSIINVILDISNNLKEEETGYSMCQTCLLDPWACENGEPVETYDPNDIFSDKTGVTTTEFVEQKTSSTHTAGSNGTTAKTSATSAVVKGTSSTHTAGTNGTTTARTTSDVAKVTSAHTAGANATTTKKSTKVFIQVEE